MTEEERREVELNLNQITKTTMWNLRREGDVVERAGYFTNYVETLFQMTTLGIIEKERLRGLIGSAAMLLWKRSGYVISDEAKTKNGTLFASGIRIKDVAEKHNSALLIETDDAEPKTIAFIIPKKETWISNGYKIREIRLGEQEETK